MKKNKVDIQRLTAELNEDKAAMKKIQLSNTKACERIAQGAKDELDYMALAYTIHNIYGIVENAGLRISKFFENNLRADFWHKELLERMKLDIPEIRPAFFSFDEYLLFDELRAFRHFFRNIYNRTLDIERLDSLQKKIPFAIESFYTAVDKYNAFLQKLSELIKD